MTGIPKTQWRFIPRGLKELDPDVDELKLCQACYLEALRMAREQAALSLMSGSVIARRRAEILDQQIARVVDLVKKP